MQWKLIAAGLLFMASCKENFIYHPNEVRPDKTDLNRKNIQRIEALPAKDTFSFILTGDTQLANAELDDFISNVNARTDIEFVIINGDLTDFGRNYEYNLLARQLNNLDIPYVSVIGNHDMLGNGRLIYTKMFGPENFSFNYGNNHFVVINSNYREGSESDQLPDLDWLQQELGNNATHTNTFIASHIAPFSADFDPGKEQQYHEIISNHTATRLSMHGHDHHFNISQPYDDLKYVVAGAMSYRNYAVIKVKGSTVIITRIDF